MAHAWCEALCLLSSPLASPLLSPSTAKQINKHKRHLDKGALLEFWRLLDEFMLLNKPEMMT